MMRIIFFLLFQLLYFHLNGQKQSSLTALHIAALGQERLEDSKAKIKPPVETAQFEFLLGTFDCIDSTLVNGKWVTTHGIWYSKLMVNDFWIKSKYRTEDFFQSSIRYFIPEENAWSIHYSNQSKNKEEQWMGKKEGTHLVISQTQIGPNGACNQHRIVFQNISEDGFDWRKETIDLHSGKIDLTHIIHATKRKDFSFAN